MDWACGYLNADVTCNSNALCQTKACPAKASNRDNVMDQVLIHVASALELLKDLKEADMKKPA